MIRMESRLEALLISLGGATAIIAACLGYVIALKSLADLTVFGELLVLSEVALVSLSLLLILSVVAVPARRSTYWQVAMERDGSWSDALRWSARTYGRGVRLGLGMAAVLLAVLVLRNVVHSWLV